ncbi:gamma-glutamyltransferase [Thalassomonas sp. M1454]|uniref:gamma-glutamyltransferase n=1 Tax=Thalassomonas sp. M1454 TaxID=2594477 RepID=UPI00118143DF|nr:gamma-glutamyltransferase [Thalassomonas sp. M1454]TRX57519.1 gamma-glutamyltransferase [Thalassomonas sp. M1454]
MTSACVFEQTTKLPREDREPEAATGMQQSSAVEGQDFMVAAANPYASEAGFNVLAKGGNAIDAAIAVQLVLTLVEPQSSGIGGGAFILYFDNEKQQLTTFDGRETAPEKATQQMFLQADGTPVRWIDAVVGGRSVGVPGVLKALETAHKKYGKLAWNELFTDAINLAENGFVVSERMAKLVAMAFNPGIKKLPAASAYFFPNGQALKAGTLLKNPALAKVYKAISEQGTDVFYKGWIAKNMVKAVHSSAIAPGTLSLNDLANYRATQTPAVCGSYKAYEVCGMAPPSSGGVAVVQILKQLEQANLSQYPVNDINALHLFTQSSRLAFADRARYIADSEFVDVPVEQLINDEYLAKRGQLIQLDKDMGKAQPGDVTIKLAQADDNAIEMPSTSHISIVDADGNAISMTTSVEMAFGSAVFVDGFLLNNQLTDFSLVPMVDGNLVANRLEPFKKPRSSMSPTMVFNADGSLRLVVGSPGGSRIINYVAQTIVGVLDWQLDIQSAIDLPKVTNRNDATTLEQGTNLETLKPQLEAMGHKVYIRNLNSGIHGIEVFNDKLVGGADPRREGKVFTQ